MDAAESTEIVVSMTKNDVRRDLLNMQLAELTVDIKPLGFKEVSSGFLKSSIGVRCVSSDSLCAMVASSNGRC